ncbi:MAG: hypothetical protein ACI33P_01015 [Lysinibacillus sp.]
MNNKLNDSLGNWGKETAQVKSRIYQETIYKQQKKPKKPFIKPLLTVAALFLFTVGTIILTTSVVKTEETQQSAEPIEFRMFDERTVEIKKYELFYRDWRFLPVEGLEYHALSETIAQHALFYHMARHDTQWDEKQRNTVRERVKLALHNEMKEDKLKAYYEKMFADLQITEEEYIDYFLLLNKEAEMLQDVLFDKGIGLDEEAFGESVKAYQQFAGFTEEEMVKLARQIPSKTMQPMDPQPELPFDTVQLSLQVTTNKQGEYIFTKSINFPTFLGYTYKAFLSDINRDIVKEALTRHSLERYQEALRTYTSSDAQKMKWAKELGAVLDIMERTIEMEYEVE